MKIPSLEKLHKIYVVLIPVVTFLVGIYQYVVGQKEVKTLEFAKMITADSLKTEQHLMEKQVDIYFKIGQSVGNILADEDRCDELNNHMEAFRVLYYGEGLIVYDPALSQAMKSFKDASDMFDRKGISKNQLDSSGEALCEILRELVFQKKSVYRSP